MVYTDKSELLVPQHFLVILATSPDQNGRRSGPKGQLRETYS